MQILGRRGSGLLELLTQQSGGLDVNRVGDRGAAGPDPGMVGHDQPSRRTQTRSRSALTSTILPIAAGSTE